MHSSYVDQVADREPSYRQIGGSDGRKADDTRIDYGSIMNPTDGEGVNPTQIFSPSLLTHLSYPDSGAMETDPELALRYSVTAMMTPSMSPVNLIDPNVTEN
jgi:hypothetical protein